MVPLLLLLPLLWGESLQEQPGYELRVQELVRVHKGLCVHVPCSFFHSLSSRYSSTNFYTYWYQHGDIINWNIPVASSNPNKQVKKETLGRFQLADPKTNNCSLSIRDARKSDAGTYIFQVERGKNVQYTYRDKKLTLQVTDKPDILIAEPLEFGRPTQLICSLPGSCEGGSPLIFSWEGAAIDFLDPQTLRSSVLTFTPRPQDQGTHLTCQVKCQGSRVTTERTIWLNVFYSPQNLTIGMSFRNVTALKIVEDTSIPIMEGKALQLLCVADSNPPAKLSWFRGSPALNTVPISRTAILELPRLGTGEEGLFTCQAQHPLGSQSISLNLSMVYPPQLLGPSCSWEDERLHCSCSCRAQPAPSLHWRLGEGLLKGNHSNSSYTITSSSSGTWTNSSLNLHEGLSAGLRLSCEAENIHGAQNASILLLPGKLVSVSGVIPAALGGASVMALLSLCLCLIFCIVKDYRRKAARRRKVTNDEDPVIGSATLSSQQKPRTDGPSDQESPPGDTSAWREEKDIQYANLRFHRRKPREPQDKEATSICVYSEISKTSK